MALIPYKETYQALQKDDNDALARLLSPFARTSMLHAYKRFASIEQKREKKNIMKAHVYLDALIRLHRLPAQIQKPLGVLAEQLFVGLNIDAVRAILEKFAEVQEVNQGEANRGRPPQRKHSLAEQDPGSGPDIKFVKTKELQKVLICNIIGVAVQLASNNRLRASVLAKTLKKNVADLKNFFTEVGLTMEACEKAKTGESDIMVHLRQPKSR